MEEQKPDDPTLGAFGPPGTPMIPGGSGPKPHPLAVTSLACGLLASPLGCCCNLFGLPLSLAAIACGAMALQRIRENPELYGGKGLATAGIVLGTLACVWDILAFFLHLTDALRSRMIPGMPIRS